MHAACKGGHTDIVRLLLSHDDIDASIAATDDGKTPLHVACDNDHTDIVSLIISHDGVDINLADSSG